MSLEPEYTRVLGEEPERAPVPETTTREAIFELEDKVANAVLHADFDDQEEFAARLALQAIIGNICQRLKALEAFVADDFGGSNITSVKCISGAVDIIYALGNLESAVRNFSNDIR